MVLLLAKLNWAS